MEVIGPDGWYLNTYRPDIAINEYYDIEKYIDDVFIALKKRTGYENSQIKENEDGKRYEIIYAGENDKTYNVKDY